MVGEKKKEKKTPKLYLAVFSKYFWKTSRNSTFINFFYFKNPLIQLGKYILISSGSKENHLNNSWNVEAGGGDQE